MDIQAFFDKNLPGKSIEYGASLAKYTTFRVGGCADALLKPASESELILAYKLCRENNIPVTLIGNGSNLLIKDGGIRGLVIRLGDSLTGIRVQENRVRAMAGESLARLSNACLKAGLTGLEFASGIPGSVGGGMAMNAGAYGGQLSDVTEFCRVLDPATGAIETLDKNELQMGYRSTRVLKENKLVLEADFVLTAGDPEQIKAQMDELNARRREKQPLSYPSAGSFFKRPEGHFAGALIEQAGLKGLSVGDARVSEKHAGFIINTGAATANDIISLMHEVQRRVFEAFGVTLEPEVRILGEDL